MHDTITKQMRLENEQVTPIGSTFQLWFVCENIYDKENIRKNDGNNVRKGKEIINIAK
jgi:hypothetical protein